MTLIYATTRMDCEVTQDITLGPSTTERVTDSGANTRQLQLKSTTTPPVTKASHFAQALTAGAATIDLTALKDTNGDTIASTGLKLQAVKVQNPNAHQLAVTPAVSNGYGLTFTVPPQGELMLTATDTLPDVASGAKNLTLAGTGSEASTWIILFG